MDFVKINANLYCCASIRCERISLHNCTKFISKLPALAPAQSYCRNEIRNVISKWEKEILSESEIKEKNENLN